jgi:hypothetical protein
VTAVAMAVFSLPNGGFNSDETLPPCQKKTWNRSVLDFCRFGPKSSHFEDPEAQKEPFSTIQWTFELVPSHRWLPCIE